MMQVVPLVLSATSIVGAHSAAEAGASPMLFLIEPGVELWLEAVCSAPEYTEELHSLFPNLHALLMRDFDHLPSGMDLIDAYVLLGGDTFMQAHGALVAEIFVRTVGEVRPEAVPKVARCLETILRRFPNNQAVLGLLEPVLATMLAAVFVRPGARGGAGSGSGGGAGSGSGSGASGGASAPESTPVICCYLTILNRVLLESSGFFLDFLARQLHASGTVAAGPPALHAAQELLGRFALRCCELYDDVSAGRGRAKGCRGGDRRRSLFDDGPWRRKLWMLTLASLLAATK